AQRAGRGCGNTRSMAELSGARMPPPPCSAWSPSPARRGRNMTPLWLLRSGRLRVALGGHQRDELAEEVIRHFACGAVNQPRADLRQLAADLRLDAVAQHGLAILLGERDLGAALGEAGDPALALAGDRVARGRVEVGEGDL